MSQVFPWPWLPVETDPPEVRALAEKLQQNFDVLSVNPQILQPSGDATTLVKGIIRLSGDLSGSADAPTVPALVNKQDTSAKGAANGYASLDSGGHVPTSQLPGTVTSSPSFARTFLLMGA